MAETVDVRVLTTAATPVLAGPAGGGGREVFGPREVFRQLARSWCGVPEAEVIAVVDPHWPLDGFEAALRRFAAARPAVPTLVTFSSGTTGRPRGICRSLLSWDRSLAAFDLVTGLRGLGDGSSWIPGPLSGSMSLFAAYHAIRSGRPVTLRGEDPADAVVVHCVPAALPGIVTQVRDGRLPRLRTAVVAGDRLPRPWWRSALDAGLRVVEYYGSAELSFCAVRVEPQAPMRPFPGVELRIRDGELWSRSSLHADGYLEPGLPGPLRRGGDGWATVGDRARWVEPPDSRPSDVVGGGLEVLGRGEDAVTVGGHTVAAGEVEDVLRAMTGVVDAAVVGLPHRLLGQQVSALVVTDRTLPELRREARTLLPRPAWPRRWTLAEAVPRTGTGKVDRDAVAAALKQR